ncbi:MAG: preprotein translocase subunit Sec61beta [archaeon]
MPRDKIQMPSGIGGLVRYFDEYRSKIEIKPGHVLALCAIVIVIMIVLSMYSTRLLGF